MRREGGRGAREPRTNNEKKSPTNIFFPFFSNPQLDLVWGRGGGRESELPVKTEGAETRAGVGRREQERAHFVRVSPFDEWAGSEERPAPCRPRPLWRSGCMGMSASGWWLLRILALSLASQGQSPLCVTSSPSLHSPAESSASGAEGDFMGAIYDFL